MQLERVRNAILEQKRVRNVCSYLRWCVKHMELKHMELKNCLKEISKSGMQLERVRNAILEPKRVRNVCSYLRWCLKHMELKIVYVWNERGT